jgi:hypothetical protein
MTHSIGHLVLRALITRALCVAAVAGWVGAAVMVVLLALAILHQVGVEITFNAGGFPLYLFIFPPLLSGYAAAWLLYLWRRCDRCRRPLYAPWWTAGPRDYRAKRLLWSFRRRAIFDTALHGKVRCMWCGQLDSEPADYVSKAPT